MIYFGISSFDSLQFINYRYIFEDVKGPPTLLAWRTYYFIDAFQPMASIRDTNKVDPYTTSAADALSSSDFMLFSLKKVKCC